MPPEGRVFRVYVIKLRKSVLRNRRFRRANPAYREGKPCVYVGSTATSPEARFESHMSGRRSSSWVRRYGKALFPWAYEREPSLPTREEAEARESALAEELRARGWAAWQH